MKSESGGMSSHSEMSCALAMAVERPTKRIVCTPVCEAMYLVRVRVRVKG